MVTAPRSVVRHRPIVSEVEVPVVFTLCVLKKWKQHREPHTTGGPPFSQVVAVFSAVPGGFPALLFVFLFTRD